MQHQVSGDSSDLAEAFYQKLRSKIETPENIGKMFVVDVDTQGYGIGDTGIDFSLKVRESRPNARLFGIRIGYTASATIGGTRKRRPPL